MLPPSVRRHDYVELCSHLTSLNYSSAENLADILQRYGDVLDNPAGSAFVLPYEATDNIPDVVRHLPWHRGPQLATKLIGRDPKDWPSGEILGLVGEVWVEMLCYVGCRCSAYSDAKQLSDGGELVTIAAFLIEYLKRDLLKATSGTSPDSHV